MHTALGSQQTEGVPALHDEGGGQQPGLLSRGRLFYFEVEAASLRPTRVHAQHHLRPVLRVGAAAAGMDLSHRVAVVVSTRELGPELEGTEATIEAVEHLFDLG